MKNVVAIMVFVIVMAFGIKAYQTPFSFCDTPITYKLGTIDPRFNLKEEKALTDISEAIHILDSGYGKKLFSYATDSSELTVKDFQPYGWSLFSLPYKRDILVINFVYDERSALNSNIDKQKSKLTKADSELQKKIESFENDAKAFQKRVEELNAKIERYNNQGGAPPDIFDQLVAEQKQLQAEGEGLNKRAKGLNIESHDFNSNVTTLNNDVTTFNKALEVKPEEGLYDGENKTISVYFVNTRTELVHTLAHEFGHAIGMDHVEDVNAIMYPKSSEYIKLTDSDKGELNRVCQSFPLPEYWVYEFRKHMAEFTKNMLKSVVGILTQLNGTFY